MQTLLCDCIGLCLLSSWLTYVILLIVLLSSYCLIKVVTFMFLCYVIYKFEHAFRELRMDRVLLFLGDVKLGF